MPAPERHDAHPGGGRDLPGAVQTVVRLLWWSTQIDITTSGLGRVGN
jgi:hypothetical protein